MNIALWIVAGLLALVFLAAGAGKLVKSRAELSKMGMTYVDDFTDGQIKAIGAVEVLGAIALIVPAFIGGIEWLVPVAAVGLTLVMIGAIIVHVRRKEQFIPPLVLGILAAFVAISRFIVGF